MAAVNERYEQEQEQLRRAAVLLALCAAVLWPVSYVAHFLAASSGPGMWWATVSIVGLAAAILTSGASVIVYGTRRSSLPPLDGDNRY